MEEKISSELIYSGRVITVAKDTVKTENGNIAYREIVHHRGGAAILAVKDGKVLMEKQYRNPYGKEIYEIPAGKRDEGETFEQTAMRELEEETGYSPEKIELLTKMYPSPGYTDEIIAIYFTDKFKKGQIHFDENEFLTSSWMDIEEVYDMIDKGLINDAKTIVALLMYKTRNV